MTSTEERIKEIARARSIPESEAAELLAAVRPPRAGTNNPFDRFGGEVTAVAGVLVALGGLATSRLGVRYDGALDLHVASGPVPLRLAALDELVAFVLTALVLWGVGRAFAKHARIVDILGAVGVARVPAVLASVPLAFLVPLVPMPPGRPNAAVLLLALVALLGAGLQIFLLVLGFRTATGLRGGRLAAVFVAGLVAAEVVGKVVLALL